MANTINPSVIANIIAREFSKELDGLYNVIPYANRKYEWELKVLWNTVTVPILNVWEWSTATTLGWVITPTDLEFTSESLVINQKMQIRHVISEYDLSLVWKDLNTTREVGKKLREKAKKVQEEYFVSKLLAVPNKVPNPVVLTGANIYNEIVRIKVEMDKKNVPTTWRKLFVSPDVAWILLQSDIFKWFNQWFVAEREGEIGKISGFMVIEANSINWANVRKMIWYHWNAWVFIEKINTMKIKEATDWNYYSLIWELFYDAWVLGNDKERVVVYEGASA